MDDLKISIFGFIMGGFFMWIGLLGIFSSEKEMKGVTKYFLKKGLFSNLPIFKNPIIPDTEEWMGLRKVVLKIVWVVFFLVGTFAAYKSVWHSG